MNASKEECRKAKTSLSRLEDIVLAANTRAQIDAGEAHVLQVQQFLDAAERKLPSEASYAKAKSPGTKSMQELL